MLDKGSDNNKILFLFYVEDFTSHVFDMRVQKICKFLFKVLHRDGNVKKNRALQKNLTDIVVTLEVPYCFGI